MLIVLEGIDGAGTTTQASLLVDYLRRQGGEVVLTGEPTQGEFGLLIQKILKGTLPPRSEAEMALLFALDRLEHFIILIKPALGSGKIVVSDRYYLSSLAYQSLEVEMGWVRELNRLVPAPRISLYLDIEPQLGLRRKRTPAERYEKLELLHKIRSNYIEAIQLLRREGEEILVLDGSPPIEDVHRSIVSALGEAGVLV